MQLHDYISILNSHVDSICFVTQVVVYYGNIILISRKGFPWNYVRYNQYSTVTQCPLSLRAYPYRFIVFDFLLYTGINFIGKVVVRTPGYKLVVACHICSVRDFWVCSIVIKLISAVYVFYCRYTIKIIRKGLHFV